MDFLHDEYDFYNKNWCKLNWTDWYPLDGQRKPFQNIPQTMGFYRICSKEYKQLMYIGQTGKSLRGRIRMLSRNTYRDVMPFDDPHTAAPNLWAYRIEENLSYFFSVADLNLEYNHRQAFEDMLIWQHRVIYGESTIANHGRFHPRYTKSKSRKRGIVGRKLEENEHDNLAGGPSHKPLSLKNKPNEKDWMGLNWSDLTNFKSINFESIPINNGLYKIYDLETEDLLYVGETNDLRNRIRYHLKKNWQDYNPSIAYVYFNNILPKYQLRELETDLIGAYYHDYNKPPIFQYNPPKSVIL